MPLWPSDKPVTKPHHLREWLLLMSHHPCILQHLVGNLSISHNFKRHSQETRTISLNMWVQRVIWERTSLPESALATRRCGPVTFCQQEAAQSWEGKESGPRRKVIKVQELQFSFRKRAEGGARMRRGCKAWFQVNSKQDGALHLLTRAGYCQEVKLPLLLQEKTHSEDWGQRLAPWPNLCLAGQGRNTRWSLDTQSSVHFMGHDCAEGSSTLTDKAEQTAFLDIYISPYYRFF